MTIAALGRNILVADMAGDRPAIITKVFTNASVEVCAFMPLPEHLKVVRIHVSRVEAIGASLKDTGYHAYWPDRV
jgi:hypothetical protein